MDPLSVLIVGTLSLLVGATVYAVGAENKRQQQIRVLDD
jgi:hypothetical protein